jgi:hypothetical protein
MVVCQLFPAAMRAALGLGMTARRFPPPWSVEETDACFIVRDANRQALAYVDPERAVTLPSCAARNDLGWPGLSGQRAHG